MDEAVLPARGESVGCEKSGVLLPWKEDRGEPLLGAVRSRESALAVEVRRVGVATLAGEALAELLDMLVEVGVTALQSFEEAVDVEGGAHGAVVKEEVEVTEAIADGVVSEEAAGVEAAGEPGGVGLQQGGGVGDEALAFAALLGEALALFGGEAG
nr:hypothetical protein [Synechococcus elongatus]